MILRIVFAGIFCTTFVGCKTASMKHIDPVPMATGISAHDAVAAVIMSADASKMPERRLPRGPIKSYADGRWSIEDAGEDFAILCYSIGQHSVRVRYDVIDREIVPTVISSENLRQSKRRIHKNAVVWINRLAPTIRESMWQIKQEEATDLLQ